MISQHAKRISRAKVCSSKPKPPLVASPTPVRKLARVGGVCFVLSFQDYSVGGVSCGDDPAIRTNAVNNTVSESEESADPPSTRLEFQIAMQICPVIINVHSVLGCKVLDEVLGRQISKAWKVLMSKL